MRPRRRGRSRSPRPRPGRACRRASPSGGIPGRLVLRAVRGLQQAGEQVVVLPGQGLELERAEQDRPARGRHGDAQPGAVAGRHPFHHDLAELVGQPDLVPHYKNTARFWVRSTDSSTVISRRARRRPSAVARSRSVRPAEIRSASRVSPRLRNSRRADWTWRSLAAARNVLTLVTKCRVREGGSSVHAWSVASRSTRLRSAYMSSSKWPISARESKPAPRAVVTRTGIT